VRFDRAFHEVLIAKKQEVNAQLGDGSGIAAPACPQTQDIAPASEQQKANVGIENHGDLQQRRSKETADPLIRTLSEMGKSNADIRSTMQIIAESRATEADLGAWNGYVEDGKARVRSQT